MDFQSVVCTALSHWSKCQQSDVKIYSVLINLNFTYCIVHKYVLIVCELASLLLDALNLVKELGYRIASRQISSGTNACKNTQTRLCSVVRTSLVILLCPWNWVASSLTPAKESDSPHWALSESPCITSLACELHAPLQLHWIYQGSWARLGHLKTHTRPVCGKIFHLKKRGSDNLTKEAEFLNRILFFFHFQWLRRFT